MKAIKSTPKRNSHSYKCLDVVYKKAMQRAKKEKTPLTQTIEDWVRMYSAGEDVGLQVVHSSYDFRTI